MNAKIINQNQSSISIQFDIPISKSMLNTEENIQRALNEAGLLATQNVLKEFDTNGEPIKMGNCKLTSKGLVSKIYQTPYGESPVERHVYQSSSGGETFCPLENNARIIGSATPKFAKMVSSKYSENGSTQVQKDLDENHNRYISRNYITEISNMVHKTIIEKEKYWEYTIPVEKENVSTIGISLDGTCMLMVNEKYRQAMVGTISLYDNKGERLYTHYTASSPEYGKSKFYEDFTNDIKHFREYYPEVTTVGIADGAKDNWTFLENFVSCQILDYFHATEYLSLASDMAFKRKHEGKEWFEKSCHKLKHEKNGAKEILEEMRIFLKRKITDQKKEKIRSCITYFENHLHQMDYNQYHELKYPIGSGVVEAACKVIIKKRLCNSGMKWKDKGAKTVLCLRCFNYSDKKWSQFWNKINKYGT